MKSWTEPNKTGSYSWNKEQESHHRISKVQSPLKYKIVKV